MNQAAKALRELGQMDTLSRMDTAIHHIHPAAKLLSTVIYIATVASFHKYHLSGLVPLLLYPVFLFAATGIPMKTCFQKLRIVLPLVCAVGILNPFLDSAPLLMLGNLPISGGFISMLTLMLKGIFCLMASFLLIATTSIDAICVALRKLHVPSLLVTLLLLTYRYVAVMVEEVANMSEAYHLRAPGQKGIHYSAWGSFVGQLLLRSMDRAGELYQSMRLRGFRGEFPYADGKTWQKTDFCYLLGVLLFCLSCRFLPLSEFLGKLVLR